MTKTLGILILGGALFVLTACGGSDSTDSETDGSDSAQRQSGPTGSNPLTGEGSPSRPSGNPLTQEQGDSGDGGDESSDAQDSAPPAPIEVASAEEAMETFMSLLTDAELERAASICVPGAPGTQSLLRTSGGWRRAEADGADMSAIKPMLVGHIRGLTWEKTEEAEDMATFVVSGPDRDPVEIEVRRIEGQWRVTPPPSGLP